MKLKHYTLIIPVLLLCACSQRKDEPVVAPWGTVNDTASTAGFDLNVIQQSGQMIILTLSGPETYYDYRGYRLGTHYTLCQHFADSLGVSLRVELCKDTAEMLGRLASGDADIIVYPLHPDSLWPGWVVDAEKPLLNEELHRWYTPAKLDAARNEMKQLLSRGTVKRRVYAPMLDKRGGIISRYDGLFVQYSRGISWDWRLMAAQCYQESTFDPQAVSWAGAKGLMQIMPGTADHLGLPREKMFDPEQNIAAAARLLAELERSFGEIRDRRERQKFVLASYNGGSFHIRDAMALARRDGKNPHLWSDVSRYVLLLSQPEYYQDPLVKNGYMRGTETVDYVEKIQQRYDQYRGVRGPRPSAGASLTPQKATNRAHRSKYQ